MNTLSLNRLKPTNIGNLSAETLAAVLDQSVDCVKIIGVDGDVQYMNANGLCVMEIDDFGPVRGQQWADLWPDDARTLISDACASAAKGETSLFRAFCPTAKGTPKWWDVTVSPIRDDEGRHAGALGISRDVSEAQKSRDALEVAAAELRHRLKNTYQIITILIGSFARGDPAHEAFASEMNKRIVALSRAQSLSITGTAPLDIAALIPALMNAFDTPSCEIAVDAPGPLCAAQPHADAIALVFGELSINSTKYGGIAHGGRIDICAEDRDGQIAIRWDERANMPVPAKPREGGQGLKLLETIVESREGTIAFTWRDHGVTVDMTFPTSF